MFLETLPVTLAPAAFACRQRKHGQSDLPAPNPFAPGRGARPIANAKPAHTGGRRRGRRRGRGAHLGGGVGALGFQRASEYDRLAFETHGMVGAGPAWGKGRKGKVVVGWLVWKGLWSFGKYLHEGCTGRSNFESKDTLKKLADDVKMAKSHRNFNE